MKQNDLQTVSSEILLSSYGIICAQEAMASNQRSRKSYIKKRLRYEQELIRRIGGSWTEFCRVNGWTEEEAEGWMK